MPTSEKKKKTDLTHVPLTMANDQPAQCQDVSLQVGGCTARLGAHREGVGVQRGVVLYHATARGGDLSERLNAIVCIQILPKSKQALG